MGITQVVRGADLMGSTARQIQLLAALDAPIPAYAHVPLVLNQAGERLAKRDGATAIRALREAGVAPERIVGLLGWSLGLRAEPTPCALADLVPGFAWERVAREPWRVDPAVLRT
jgi:glutamyl-tRNA synthetase